MKRIGDIFNDSSITSSFMEIWIVSLDSVDQIWLSTFSREVSTPDEGVCRWRFKICEIWDVINYCGTTRSYRRMDGTIRFRASNRSNGNPEGRSNGGARGAQMERF